MECGAGRWYLLDVAVGFVVVLLDRHGHHACHRLAHPVP